jgi:hypothetical protein
MVVEVFDAALGPSLRAFGARRARWRTVNGLAVAAGPPSGPAYTVVLVGHVGAVLVLLVSLVAGAAAAIRALAAKGGELAPSVRSYFSPGVNWAGRALYLVPVLGVALLGMSGGAYRWDAAWVDWGIGLWVAAAGIAEGVLWPAERRVGRALASAERNCVSPPARRACRTVCAATAAVAALVVAAMVVMVAKP